MVLGVGVRNGVAVGRKVALRSGVDVAFMILLGRAASASDVGSVVTCVGSVMRLTKDAASHMRSWP